LNQDFIKWIQGQIPTLTLPVNLQDGRFGEITVELKDQHDDCYIRIVAAVPDRLILAGQEISISFEEIFFPRCPGKYIGQRAALLWLWMKEAFGQEINDIKTYSPSSEEMSSDMLPLDTGSAGSSL
jgi:hypothetical protein